MEKINVAELLKDCPSGMELDCAIYNNVEFEGISDNKDWPIKISVEGYPEVLNPYGCISYRDYTKCVIFPKGKTTWEGFVPPCNFKNGDILYCDANDSGEDKDMFKYIFIFDKIVDVDGTQFYYSYCHLFGSEFYTTETNLVNDYPVRFATEKEKQKLFQAIKDNGFRWNPETKTLEKLPKFKVGDRIVKKNGVSVPILITKVSDEFYYSNTKSSVGVLSISEQDDWELVPNESEKLIEPKFKVRDRIKQIGSPRCYIIQSIEFDRYILHNGQFLKFGDEHIYELVPKFDINILVPFESRVLVRAESGNLWKPAIFGCYVKDKYAPYYVLGGTCWSQCIPYEGNKHLLGIADDCDEYFKNWK